MADCPAVVLIFSGKRKSGKDYVVTKLAEMLGDIDCEVLRLSAPLKKQYAIEHNLDFDKLLDSSSYKERYRGDMISWGEGKRKADPNFFCNLATKEATKRVWIISDARRKTDLDYFSARFNTIHVRVVASEKTRTTRGWNFMTGIDDAESECGLDQEHFDIVVDNDGDTAILQQTLEKLTQIAQSVGTV
ncbi:phosphomevalonate kinase-like [Dendronephthya gigantea]|uniref:phosphomevalonate kinase-like n=1 Tax=Dendronephthya gigantea TaxID=151771 RepID=UPI00106C9F3D|nr:phosphomevalonate kinase-like [Dendronephthya gigantea]